MTEVLFRLYGASWGPIRILEYQLFGKNEYRHAIYGKLIHRVQKHSPVSDIPGGYSGLAILATVRDPLDLLVSEYEFRWWQRKEFVPYYRVTPAWRDLFSSFPRVTFPGFLSLMHQAFLPQAWLDAGLGYALFTFVRYYCRDSKQLIAALPTIENYENRLRRIQESVRDITFISTARLNLELHDRLASLGYLPEDLKFILDKQRVHPLGRGRSAAQACDKYFTHGLRDKTLEKERLMVDLLQAICTS